MRLTVDLIMQSPQYISPTKNWTLCMRGYRIEVLENLGATGDYFECIDLCDNEVLKLANFPPLKRLNTLLFCNNRISRIAPDISENLPNLVSLTLSNNKIEKLCDLEPLFKVTRLERLSLVDNPVAESPYYRSFVIHHLPNLRFLDFKKVKSEERKLAARTFEGERGSKLLQDIAPPRVTKSGENDPASQGDKDGGQSTLSAEQMEEIKNAISKAATMEEINELENALRRGTLPAEKNSSKDGATPMETDAPTGSG